jgi:hypothetical protein
LKNSLGYINYLKHIDYGLTPIRANENRPGDCAKSVSLVVSISGSFFALAPTLAWPKVMFFKE